MTWIPGQDESVSVPAARNVLLGLTVKPEMPLADFMRLFDLSANHADQYDKPLEAREIGYLEMVRTDTEGDARARVRIAYRYDENFDITITGEERPKGGK